MRHDRSRSIARLAVWMALALLPPAAFGAEAAKPPESRSLLRLANGGFAEGTLVDSPARGRVRWQSSAFAAPLEFALGAVYSVQLPSPAEPLPERGDMCLELAGGDVVFGKLVDLNDQLAVLEVPRVGRLEFARTRLQGLGRLGSSEVVFVGPAGLAGWRPPVPEGSWREVAGQLFSDVDGAVLKADFRLPARVVVDFELFWHRKPDFVLALGVGDDAVSLEHAYRFEVWDENLVVRCETAHEADVMPIGTVSDGEGRASFRALLDQEAGRLVVQSAGGKTLATISLKEKAHQVSPGLTLINNKGSVRLERLRVQAWSGSIAGEGDRSKPHVQLTDGTTVPGTLAQFDGSAHEFVVRDEAAETRVAENRFSSAVLAPPEEHAGEHVEGTVRVVAHDGSRLSGALLKVEGGNVWLAVSGTTSPVRLPVAALHSLMVLKNDLPRESVSRARTGTLELDGVHLRGHLVDGQSGTDALCLAWKPEGSMAGSPLRAGVAGSVVYKQKPAQAPERPRPVQAQQAQMNVLVLRQTGAAQPRPRTPEPVAQLGLHLRTGDFIPCEVTAIDENGVRFRSSLSEASFVAHDRVKAVELAASPRASIEKAKLDRLLTLPRMQKESPPTHLVQSRDGDYLRGRVLKLNDATLEVEIHLEATEIPRNRVARIIWLHRDESLADQPAAQPATEPDTRALRIQAVRNDGIRLTFRAERCADGVLIGRSDVLGGCRVPVKELDQVVIGTAIEREAAQLPYPKWKLHDAPEPKYVTAEPGGSSGTESDLVGHPAPDFTLEWLDGKTFHLAEAKGKVVVLDFWATWCGPCLQAMPQVERVASEFAEKGVQLVAVNLEEAPKTIQAMLERQKLKVSVALDRDGVVAGKYKANAIPQTVVIDREGNVARVFVGSSPRLGDQLREAIEGALKATESKDVKP